MMQGLEQVTPGDPSRVLREAVERASGALGAWVGNDAWRGGISGELWKCQLDAVAVTAIHETLSDGQGVFLRIMNGEGEKDEAPMLPHGGLYGSALFPLHHVALDPLEGTSAAATNKPGALSVIAASEGGMYEWNNRYPYMEKLAVGPEAAHLLREDHINVNGCPVDTMRVVARALGKKPEQLRVAVLERDRNRAVLAAAELLGVEVVKLSGGDLTQQILCSHTDPNRRSVDMLMGSGGGPEGVLGAAYHIATGLGEMQGRPYVAADSGVDPRTLQVLSARQLVGVGNVYFAACGVTDGPLLDGPRYYGEQQVWLPGDTLFASSRSPIDMHYMAGHDLISGADRQLSPELLHS